MKGRRTLLVAMGLLAVLLVPRSWAEEAVPTITGLRAAIHGDTIILSWTDDGPEAKAYAVYRSEKPFDGATLAGIASVAVVAPGKQNYVDRPPQGSSFFYAVAAISSEGQVLFAFRANQNATVVAISAEAPQVPAASAQPAAPPAVATAAAPLPASSPSPAAPLNGEPLIEKAAPGAETKPPEPPVQPTVPSVAPQPSKPVTETPRPQEAAAAPAVISTAEPALAPVPRSSPLPAFLYRDSSILPGVDGAASSGTGDLPPETAKALHQLQDETESVDVAGPELRLLPRAQREGDAATILLAAESLLLEGDWAGARAILEPLSRSGNPSPEGDCAHFYIGITLAQEGRYRDALFEFLAVREAYPAQTKPWIDFVVEGLARP